MGEASLNPRAWDWEHGNRTSAWNDTQEQVRKEKETLAAAEEKKAKQKVLDEQAAIDQKRSAQQRFMAQTTSGFGANQNLARAFLTSL